MCMPRRVWPSMSRERDQRGERDDHDPELGTADVQPAERDRRGDVRAELAHLGSRDELDDVAEHEREAEGHQQQLQDAGALAAHRPPHHRLEAEREQRRHHERERQRERERKAERGLREDRHVGAEREELAVREVHELQHAVDERQSRGAEREVRARDEPVDRRLREIVHALRRSASDDRRGEHRADDDQERAPARVLRRDSRRASSPARSRSRRAVSAVSDRGERAAGRYAPPCGTTCRAGRRRPPRAPAGSSRRRCRGCRPRTARRSSSRATTAAP